MRRYILAAAVVIMALTCSCSKNGAAGFCGSYSFKHSGVLTVERDELTRDGEVILEADVITRSLVNESGQMDIVKSSADDNSVIITMNIIGGGLVILDASFEDGELIIPEQTRRVSLMSLVANLESTDCLLTVHGSASKVENLIIFNLEYEGDYTEGGRSCHVSQSEISCRAKLNED
ncbi:MAG: hypothetical protein MJY67_02320 [Bacteroidales bacterium]|nr:hypothetical protein [Bacteroidales bacterium]